MPYGRAGRLESRLSKNVFRGGLLPFPQLTLQPSRHNHSSSAPHEEPIARTGAHQTVRLEIPLQLHRTLLLDLHCQGVAGGELDQRCTVLGATCEKETGSTCSILFGISLTPSGCAKMFIRNCRKRHMHYSMFHVC